MDSCYFTKLLEDGSVMDITAHVDDLLITDNNAELADREIAKLHAALPLKHSEKPEYFLGSNLHVHSRADMSMSSQAYVKQLATTVLPKPLASYSYRTQILFQNGISKLFLFLTKTQNNKRNEHDTEKKKK